VSVNLIHISEIAENRDYLLAHMSNILAGNSLQYLIVIDAFMVLSGAVLTSCVGVTGLVRQMTLDQVLPRFLLKKNKRRGTYHRITIGFFSFARPFSCSPAGASYPSQGFTLSPS
jgi:amino acid transporter